MWWRLRRSEFDANKGARNRVLFRAVVERGEVPGVLLYDENRPVGWCSVAPREHLPVLGRSRALRPIDDASPWSVVCLFVRKDHRRTGTSVQLLRAAADHAAANGATIVEGYPVEPRKGSMPDAFAWTGTVSAFRAAGFEEAARGPTGRVIMRRAVGQA
jgi:GNAT superfamily N-acetyltransferase